MAPRLSRAAPADAVDYRRDIGDGNRYAARMRLSAFLLRLLLCVTLLANAAGPVWAGTDPSDVLSHRPGRSAHASIMAHCGQRDAQSVTHGGVHTRLRHCGHDATCPAPATCHRACMASAASLPVALLLTPITPPERIRAAERPASARLDPPAPNLLRPPIA